MAMLVFNLISAVMTALVKKALQQGLNALVLITLRQLVATLFLAPIAYFKERCGVYARACFNLLFIILACQGLFFSPAGTQGLSSR